MNLRHRALSWVFETLYRRLAFAHEATGWMAFGAAWATRRAVVAERALEVEGTLLDIGCGEGRLLQLFRDRRGLAVGIEPSPFMARRAAARGCLVARGEAQRLPLRSGVISVVVCTYPGAWVLDDATHAELSRVTAPGGSLFILLGGTYVTGRAATLRHFLHRLAYGRAREPDEGIDVNIRGFSGELTRVDDEWGVALLWVGTRDV